jgi:hypothetical protein
VTRARASLLVAAAAVIPRLAVLLHEQGAILANNTEKSDTFATTFVHTGTFGFVPGLPSADTQPLYGWFLIPLYWIFGRSWETVGLAQIAVAVCTALLVYEIGRRFLSPRAGVVGALAATLNPYLVWHDVHVNREILDQLLAAALVLLTLLVARRPTLPLAAALGVVLGLAMLGNTRLFALPVVVAAFLVWQIGLVGRAGSVAAVVLACAGIAVLPWLVRNKVQVGCWALTTDARAFWKANNPDTYGVLARGGWIDDVNIHLPRGRPLTAEEAQTRWQRDHVKVDVHECAQVGYYEDKVFAFWVDHPGEKGKLMAQAAAMLWNPRVTETTGRSGAGTSLDLGRRWVAPIYTGVLFALAVVGLFVVSRAVAVLAVLLLAYDTVTALAFAGATRYRVPWDFLIALLAGAAIARAWARVRARRPVYA